MSSTNELIAELRDKAGLQDGPGQHVLRLIGQYLEGRLTRPLAKTKITKVLCSKMVCARAMTRAETILSLLAELTSGTDTHERSTNDELRT